MLNFNETITTSAYVNYERITGSYYHANLNWSNIISELIKAAGTYVQNYNSDIYYDIQNLNRHIENPTDETIVWCLQFRDNGIIAWDVDPCSVEEDSNRFSFAIPEHEEGFNSLRKQTRAVYLLGYRCVAADDNEHPGYEVNMWLTRV